MLTAMERELLEKIEELEAEMIVLKEHEKHLMMRLTAIKLMVTAATPACSKKLEEVINSCGGCQQ